MTKIWLNIKNIVNALMTACQQWADNTPASVVAKVIFEAATDGKIN
jgi:hypothetical protein